MKILKGLFLLWVAGFFFSCTTRSRESIQELDVIYYKAYQAMHSEPELALSLIENSVKQALDLNLKGETIKAYRLQAYIYEHILVQPEKALESNINLLYQVEDGLLEDGSLFSSSIVDSNSAILLEALYNIGSLYYKLSYTRTSADVFIEGLILAKKFDNEEFIGRFNYSLAVTNMNIKSFKQAEEYITNAQTKSLQENDTTTYVDYGILESCVLIQEKNYPSARKLLISLMRDYKNMSADQELWALNNLGLTYILLDSLPKAEHYLTLALKLTNELNSPSRITLNNMGRLSFLKGDLQKAQEYYIIAEQLPLMGMQDEDQLATYEGMAKTQKALGNDELALLYNQKAIDHMKPLVKQVDKLRTYAGLFEEWQHSRDFRYKTEMIEARMIVMYILMAFGALLSMWWVYNLTIYQTRVRLKAELRAQREINRIKDLVVYNFRALF